MRVLITSASYHHLIFFKMPVQKLKFGWCNKEGWCSHGCQRVEVVAIEVRTSLFCEIQISQTLMLTPTVLVWWKLIMDSYGIDFWISLEEHISECPKLPMNSWYAAGICLVSKCLKLLMDSYKIDFWISLEEHMSKCPKLPMNSWCAADVCLVSKCLKLLLNCYWCDAHSLCDRKPEWDWKCRPQTTIECLLNS